MAAYRLLCRLPGVMAMSAGPHYDTTRTAHGVGLGQGRKGSPAGLAVWPWLICSSLVACAATPPPLELPEIALVDPAFLSSVEASSGAPILGNNRVDILLNGEQTFPALLDAVRSATRTLTFEAYIFHEG